MKKILCLILLSIILFPKTSFAFTMQGGEYNLKSVDIEQGPLIPESTTADPAEAETKVQDYSVTYGFDNLKDTSPLVFSISDSTIDFGQIVAGEAITRTNTLTIQPGASLGYDILISEDHEPTATGAKIPDTTCDDGNCTETTSSSWASPLTYGFGVRCEASEGNYCFGFLGSNDFKQPANSQLLENGQPIMSSKFNNKASSNILYKLNIAGNQLKTNYTNTLLFLASPHI